MINAIRIYLKKVMSFDIPLSSSSFSLYVVWIYILCSFHLIWSTAIFPSTTTFFKFCILLVCTFYISPISFIFHTVSHSYISLSITLSYPLTTGLASLLLYPPLNIPLFYHTSDPVDSSPLMPFYATIHSRIFGNELTKNHGYRHDPAQHKTSHSK